MIYFIYALSLIGFVVVGLALLVTLDEFFSVYPRLSRLERRSEDCFGNLEKRAKSRRRKKPVP